MTHPPVHDALPAAADAWMCEHVRLVAPLDVRRMSGGWSNLTYCVVDAAGRRVVLRAPPVAEGTSRTHDILRERDVLAALQATDVPTPAVLASCHDESVIGVPFFVMEWAPGQTLQDPQAAAALSTDARRQVGLRFADALAAVHAVDVDAVGLTAMGRPEPYVVRELRRWSRQWAATRPDGGDDFERAAEALGASLPAFGPPTLVHGDPHLRNVLVSTTGSISALLDWELSTIGDPLADLGQALVYWQRDDDDLTPIGPMASSVPGMVDRRGLIDRYAATSGVRPERLDWYVAFATWKLAAVLNGVHARERAGAYGPVVSRPTEEADMPQRLAARALRLATELH